MSIADRVVIIGLGAQTVVGRDAWSSAAAVRAGISGFVRHPFMIDTAGASMHAAIAPWLDIDLHGVDRFAALLLPAVEEALNALPYRMTHSTRCALALALPNTRPSLPDKLVSELLHSVQRRYPGTFESSAVFENGHAAGQLALGAAHRALIEGRIDAVVVAGVDSWIEPRMLEWLESRDQLHGAGSLNNAWGFIPGEAGAAILLVREQVARALHLNPMAAVLAVGRSHESKRVNTEAVCIGEGLTAAFRETLRALPPGACVSDIYCDMNGEPHRADEFGFTALRTKEHFSTLSDFHAPADCWGDVSAAGSLLHVMLACVAAHKHYATGSFALAWASSETGERAATLLTFVQPSSGGT